MDAALLIGCLIPMLIVAYTDAKWYMVYDLVTVPIMLSGLVDSIHTQRVPDALLGMLFVGGILTVGAIMGGVGIGDVKLAVGLGLWFGFMDALVILFLASIIGVVWGLVKLICSNRIKNQKTCSQYSGVVCGAWGALNSSTDNEIPKNAIPFGTCLALAAWIIFSGKVILS